MMILKPLFACAACLSTVLVLGVAVAPGFAAEPVTITGKRIVEDAPTKTVRYGDLNLTSAAGEKALFRRVGAAVRDVCHVVGSPMGDYRIVASCRKFAWSGARPQIASALQRARLNPHLAATSMTISIAAR